jgi:hypothetical protein
MTQFFAPVNKIKELVATVSGWFPNFNGQCLLANRCQI